MNDRQVGREGGRQIDRWGIERQERGKILANSTNEMLSTN